jgi:hypothetical protein
MGKSGMSDEEVANLTDYVLSFFGFDNVVVDNRLSPSDRDVFYTLEEAGLLTTTQEEVTLRKGKVWRLHYWILKKEYIQALAQGIKAPKEKAGDDSASVYEKIDEDVWHRG